MRSLGLLFSLLFSLFAAASAQNVAITFTFTGDGNGNSNGFTGNGSGTLDPYGAATGSLSGKKDAFTITFTLSDGDTLAAYSSSAITGGSAQVTGGTGVFAGATGSFTYAVSCSSSDCTSTGVGFTLSGSGEITLMSSSGGAVAAAPQTLTFNASLNGGPPPSQSISVVPAVGATGPANFAVTVDGGQTGTPAPAWISVTPLAGVAPEALVVSVNQGSMAAGSYSASILVGSSSVVSVTLNVASAPQKLNVSPAMLSFSARAAAPGALTADLAVSSTGSGSVNFTTSVVNNSPWIASVTGSGSTTPGAPVFVQVQVNTSGLAVGAYHDAILISSSAGNLQVPVSLFVAAGGAVLGLDAAGFTFTAVQGGGSTASQTVYILNLGDPASTVHWTASLLSGSNFLNLQSTQGTATSTTEGELEFALAPDATQLSPGPYYANIQVSDPDSLNSPRYVNVVLNLEPSTSAPSQTLSPSGVFFTSAAGAVAPPGQQVQVNTSSATNVAFTATASTNEGGNWLSVTPASGTVNGQQMSFVTASVNPTGLAPGVYFGSINISIGAALRSVNVTFVVQPGGSSSAVSRVRPRATGCTPTQVVITETGLPNNFAVPAGWPATLVLQLNDDCGSPVTNGNVSAGFSNGDQALALAGDNQGNYSSTWQPGNVNAETVITFTATAGALAPASSQLHGGVAANSTPPPSLAAGGTVNNFNPTSAAPLAPGTIAQVYGANLAFGAASTGAAPLPTMFDSTFALVGSSRAPLYFLSSGQINLQIPSETTENQQMQMILSVNNALTLPLTLNIVPATPGVLSDDDGPTPPSLQNGAHIIAQHSADFSLVSSANPAKPGEYLVMYLVGMGATNPSVSSGAPSPSSAPLATVVLEPTVTVGGQASTVAFAGLTPGFVGLYQVNFQVPRAPVQASCKWT